MPDASTSTTSPVDGSGSIDGRVAATGRLLSSGAFEPGLDERTLEP